jgi:hypothetical protein
VRALTLKPNHKGNAAYHQSLADIKREEPES